MSVTFIREVAQNSGVFHVQRNPRVFQVFRTFEVCGQPEISRKRKHVQIQNKLEITFETKQSHRYDEASCPTDMHHRIQVGPDSDPESNLKNLLPSILVSVSRIYKITGGHLNWLGSISNETHTHTYTHTRLTAFAREYPGEPVPER